MKFPLYLFILFFLFSFQFTTNNPALSILENKCNACHLKRKRAVFTEKNMPQHAPKIYEQVFIKERMPRGKKNKLTSEEMQILKEWLIKTGIDFSKK